MTQNRSYTLGMRALFVFAIIAVDKSSAEAPKQIAADNISAETLTRDPDAVKFPRNYWDPRFKAQLLLIEFLKNGWETRIKLDPPPRGKNRISDEVSHLHDLKRLREERNSEIKAQADDFFPEFANCLMINEQSYPRTVELMHFPGIVAGPLAFYFKARFDRPRPSQLAPDLQPILTVPGHPSYPSGHAVQSHLVASVLADVRPDARTILFALARRISENREIAGLHYPSDTRAGEELSKQAYELAVRGLLFQQLLAEAKAEWR